MHSIAATNSFFARCCWGRWFSRKKRKMPKPPKNLLHPRTRRDERMGHLIGLQVAGAKGEARHVARENRCQLECVAANCFVFREDDPATASGFAQSLRIGGVIGEVRDVFLDQKSGCAKIDRDLSAERPVDEPGERLRRLHSSRTGLRPRSVRRRGGSPARDPSSPRFLRPTRHKVKVRLPTRPASSSRRAVPSLPGQVASEVDAEAGAPSQPVRITLPIRAAALCAPGAGDPRRGRPDAGRSQGAAGGGARSRGARLSRWTGLGGTLTA